MPAPVIGITRCRSLDDYVASIEQAGARARVLEINESPSRLVGEIHGLLLTGGGDVDPVLYGEARHESVEDAEPGRDEFEIDLARRAMSADLPVLAICRGAQVLNVAAGGTLVQDIPSTIGRVLDHSIIRPRDAHAHDVHVAAGSRLERALGPAVTAHTCVVNSRHHQSVGRLGAELIATATAQDSVIEGIEKPDARFCVGVQWHPENFWQTGEFNPLFDAFVTAARERLQNRLGQPPIPERT
jgi:putative glutamine amidotransferase